MRLPVIPCVLLLLIVVPPQVFADDAAARTIIKSAIEHNGGETRLGKLKLMTSKIKGSVHINGVAIPFAGEFVSHGGNQQRITVTLNADGQMITFASVLNQESGWRKIGDNVEVMSAEQLAEAKASAYSAHISTLYPLREKEFQLATFGDREVAGRQAVGITVSREGFRPINLLFDKENYRLLRTEMTVRDESTFKEVPEESTMSDFKEFDGIPHATKITVKRNGELHAEIEVEDFKPSDKVDESLFAKP